MARQYLNIHLSQRQLLADNTDRAADNRWSKEDRSRRKKTTTTATTPDPTTSASHQGALVRHEKARHEKARGGGSPDRYLPNDPAANRRKKFDVFILDAPYRFDEVVETFSQPHTEYRTEFVQRNYGTANYFVEIIEHPYTISNSYTIANHTWYAQLQKETGNSRKVIIGEKHEILNRLTEFGWTFRQKSNGLAGGSFMNNPYPSYQAAPIPGIVASPAPLPGTLDDWFYPKAKVIRGGFPTKKHDPDYNSYPDRENIAPSFSASNGRYIWYTTIFVERQPQTNFERVGNDWSDAGFGSRLRDESVYPSNPQCTIGSAHCHKTVRKEFGYFNYGYFGDTYYPVSTQGDFSQTTSLTWRFDTDSKAEDFNPEPQKLINTFFAGANMAYTDTYLPFYLDALDGAHPMRERWQTRKAQFSDAVTAARAFFEEDFPLYHENLVYYKDTGLMTYTEVLKKDDLWGSIPRIYTKKIEPNQEYFIVHAFGMPGGTSFNKFLTSHETMLASGWEEASRKLNPNFNNDQSLRPIYNYTHRTSPKQ